MKRKLSRSITPTLKIEIAASQQYNCAICKNLLGAKFQIDHKNPFAIDQDNSRENLQALCLECHAHKTPEDNKKTKKHKIDNGIIKLFECDCNPDHKWQGEKNYNKHLKSVKHILYENEELRKENMRLSKQIIDWKNIYFILNPTATKSPF